MRLVIAFLRNQRGTMVADVAKAGAAIAFLSVIAANFVSSQTAHLDRDAMRQATQAFIRQQRAIMSRPDARPVLATISVPTLVVVGEEDAITPPDEAREIAAGIGTKVRYLEVPGCGHLSTLEAPQLVTSALLGWLG